MVMDVQVMAKKIKKAMRPMRQSTSRFQETVRELRLILRHSEGERQAEAQNRAQDVDNRYWVTLEETGRRVGEMIADNSNHYDEDELYDMIPDEQETFDWYRQQMLMRGEGVETHLVHAGHELAGLINQIPDTAMTQRVVLNGDMFGRLQILHKEILEAIDDCTTPEGCRRSFRFIKKLQWLEREAIEKATNDVFEHSGAISTWRRTRSWRRA